MTTSTVGFVFPGQGSQSLGMLKDIAAKYPEIEQTFKTASSVLGYDLWQLTQQGPAEALNQTAHTQPALLAASYAVWQLFAMKNGARPLMLAGHSLGEYTALVCANALSFTDAIALVAARGQFMQDAVPVGQGALAALVGLENNEVQAICDAAKVGDEVLSPANFNCPGQVVIAGHIAAVLRAITLAKEKGVKLAMQLPVSVPSHCALMKPAADRLAERLKQLSIQTPEIPVISNVDVTIYDSADAIRDGLTRQLYRPVRWVETVEKFMSSGVTHLIECGPGKVLSGLNKRIAPSLQLSSTSDLTSLEKEF